MAYHHLYNDGFSFSQTSIASGDTISNTNVATSFATGFTLRDGALADGRSIKIHAAFRVSTTGTPTLGLKLFANQQTVALLTFTAWTLGNNLSATLITLNGHITTTGYGKSATNKCVGIVDDIGSNIRTASTVPSIDPQLYRADLSQIWTMQATFSAQDPANIIVMHQFDLHQYTST